MVLVQPRKTRNRLDMTEKLLTGLYDITKKIVGWDVNIKIRKKMLMETLISIKLLGLY